MKRKLTDNELEEWLSAELSKGPQLHIPEKFASRVTIVVKVKEAQRVERRWTILIWSLFVSSLIFSSIFMWVFAQPILSSILSLIVDYKWMIIFSLSIIVILHIADRQLIFRRQFIRI